MHHLNQSFEEVLLLIKTLVLFFLASVVFSFFFLKLVHKEEKNSFKKAFLPNLTFFSFSFILYLFAISKNINISVFSRNEVNESLLILSSLIFTLIILSFIEIILYNVAFNSKPIKKYVFLLLSLNLFCYSFIFFSFYPKPYVDKNILNYNRYLYKPNKEELKLFDKSILKLSFACSSENNYKSKRKDSFFNFRISTKQIGKSKILYSFKLLDWPNEFDSSGNNDNCETFSINKLENEIKVILMQEQTEMHIGSKLLATDTIIFNKIKVEKRQAGYYGDTNCDCIER